MLSASSAQENILQDCHTRSHWPSCSPWQAMPWDKEDAVCWGMTRTRNGIARCLPRMQPAATSVPAMTGMLSTCSGCCKTKEQLQVTVVQHNPQPFSSTLRPAGGRGKGRDCGEVVSAWFRESLWAETNRSPLLHRAKIPVKMCMHTPLTPQDVEGKTQNIKTQQHH